MLFFYVHMGHLPGNINYSCYYFHNEFSISCNRDSVFYRQGLWVLNKSEFGWCNFTQSHRFFNASGYADECIFASKGFLQIWVFRKSMFFTS